MRTEFQLKMTMIGEDIARKVFFAKLKLIFGPSLTKMLSKVARFGRMSSFYDVPGVQTLCPPTHRSYGGQI